MSIFGLIFVMFLSGGIGGIASCIISPPDDKKLTIKGPYIGVIALGTIVAFTVPLFLSLAQSRLVDEIINPPQSKSVGASVLVLVGFCIIAAFTARRFLEGLSDRILADIQAVKKDVKEHGKQIESIDEALEENIISSEPKLEIHDKVSNLNLESTSKDATELLKVLHAASRNTKRTLTGISRDSNLDRETAQAVVDKAISKRLIEMTTSDRTGGRRFRLTPAGTAELTKQLALPPS